MTKILCIQKIRSERSNMIMTTNGPERPRDRRATTMLVLGEPSLCKAAPKGMTPWIVKEKKQQQPNKIQSKLMVIY